MLFPIEEESKDKTRKVLYILYSAGKYGMENR